MRQVIFLACVLRWIFLLTPAAPAATLYVSSMGNDMTGNGTSGAPWLTLARSLDQSNMAGHVNCGDTLMVAANGASVSAENAVLPPLPGCGVTTTIQSPRLSEFLPTGYRTNPVRDAALYGKLSCVTACLTTQSEVHGGTYPSYNNTYSRFTTSNGSALITIHNDPFAGPGSVGVRGLAVGGQVEFEFISTNPFPAVTLPSPLVFQQHYYVVAAGFSCVVVVGCADGSTFEIATTPGGTPIVMGACGGVVGACLTEAVVLVPVMVDTATDILTLPDAATSAISNNTQVFVAASGPQTYGVLPTPLALDTIYFVVNKTDSTHLQLSTSLGGAPIDLTTVGTGMFSIATADATHNWALRGLEFLQTGSTYLYYFLQIGVSTELSVLGMPNNMEVDRLYFHGNDDAGNYSLFRCTVENGFRVYVHDSYCAGGQTSGLEVQGFTSIQSQGAAYVNNFIGGATENTICGGQVPSGGLRCQHQAFIRNYYYHPPAWRYTTGTTAASGACLYDTTDPLRSGGEWYRDTMAAQNYRCGSNGLWATTGASPPSGIITLSFKDLAEHKNGCDFLYDGNIFRYAFIGGQYEAINNSGEANDSGPGACNDHITTTNNAFYDVLYMMTRSDRCLATPYLPCTYPSNTHVTSNNLIVLNPNVCGISSDTNTCPYHAAAIGQYGWGMFNGGATLQGDDWHKNTFWAPDSFPFTNQPTIFHGDQYFGSNFGIINRSRMQDNLLIGDYKGDASSDGGGTIANFFTNSAWTNNVFKAGSSGAYGSPGAGNTFSVGNTKFPANNAAVVFVNGTGTIAGDYRLGPTSDFSASNGAATLLSTDGTDLGADIDKIVMETSGVGAGTPPWYDRMSFRLDNRSTKVVFNYQALTSAVYTATVYTAPARIPANIVGAATADSCAGCISDGLRRQLLYNGVLTASTHYWYKLVGAGGVILVGDFWTLPLGSGTYTYSFQFPTAQPVKYCTDKAMTAGCVTTSSATVDEVPVASGGTVRYAQSTNSGMPEFLLVTP